MKKVSIFICFSALLSLGGFAQTPGPEFKLDSLVRANDRYLKQDETKLKMLNQLAFGYSRVNPAKGIETGEQAISLAQKLKPTGAVLAEAYNNKALNHTAISEYTVAMGLFEKALALNKQLKNNFGIAENTFNIGEIYRQKGDNKKSKTYFEEAMILFESIHSKEGIARAYNGVGNIYTSNEPTKALDYYHKALNINEQLGNKSGMAVNFGNIGNGYRYLSDYSKALEYYQKALNLNKQLGNKNQMAANLGNIGIIYYSLSDYPKALEYHQESLKLYEQLGNKNSMANKLGNIGSVYNGLSDYPKALEYHQKSLDINEQLGNKNGMAASLGNIGIVYRNLSDYPKALEYYHKALTINEQLGNKSGIAINLGNIGIMYRTISDYTKALEYQQKALSINEQLGNKSSIATSLGNIGSVYSDLSDFPKALEYHQKALNINEESGNKNYIALNLGNIGGVYSNLSDYTRSLEYYQRALKINEQLGNKNGLARNLGSIGKVYRDAPDSVLQKAGINPAWRFTKALEYENKSLQIAKDIGDVSQQKEAWQNMSITYEMQGDFSKAYEAYKNYIVLHDSIKSDEVKNNIQRKEMQYEFDKKETALKYEKQLSEEKYVRSQQELGLRQKDLVLSNKEKDLQLLAYLKEKAEKQEKEKQLSLAEREKQLQASQLDLLGKEKQVQLAQLKTQQQEIETKKAQRNLFLAGTVLFLLLASSIFVGLRRTAKEKRRSDELLLNILPSEVAEELKDKGTADAKQFDEVTVMFTDFKNFTQISEKLSPAELVAEIHTCFKAFDNIISKYNIEKIKTIGDAYMCAGGLPVASTTHASDVVRAAIEIRDFMATRHYEIRNPKFEIRIGVHTGPVVAGIVGVKKFAYDIWGDTVNIASRMESSGEAGKINISGNTYERVKEKFNCVHRGKITAKNKGEIDMYFVNNSVSEG